MMNLIDLTGKTIVVAGASSGIGKKTAIVLSKIGARLILIARREDRLIETISELEGSGHSYYVADLSQVNDIENLVKGMIKENGPVDGLVYSTGISLSSPFSLAKPDKIEKSFQVNFFGFMELTRTLSAVSNTSFAALDSSTISFIIPGTCAPCPENRNAILLISLSSNFIFFHSWSFILLAGFPTYMPGLSAPCNRQEPAPKVTQSVTVLSPIIMLLAYIVTLLPIQT
jgi:hypothetical protein